MILVANRKKVFRSLRKRAAWICNELRKSLPMDTERFVCERSPDINRVLALYGKEENIAQWSKSGEVEFIDYLWPLMRWV